VITRLLESKLKTLSLQFPVITIVGPRQSGKSTLARMAFPTYTYLSLETPSTLARALDDPIAFLTQYSSGVIIDEAQNAPELFSYLQEIVDTNQTMGRYILTGSQNFLLFSKISQSLAGRVGLLTLLPFSLPELPELTMSLNDLLWTGLYPPVHDRQILPSDWYPSYIRTYVERDVRQTTNIQDLNTFQRFLRLCAGRAGQLINFTDLANDAGISRNTAKAWLSILEASYIVYFLNPYHENFNKRLVKQSKLYFYDTGLIASLLDIQRPQDLDVHFARGSLFENFVISEIYKSFSHRGISPKLFFWRDHGGHEVDLIIESGQRIAAVEIKSGMTVTKSHLSQLRYFRELHPSLKTIDFHLVYAGDTRYIWDGVAVKDWRSIPDIS
jgi:predicted AAA+ superfamily ATPase